MHPRKARGVAQMKIRYRAKQVATVVVLVGLLIIAAHNVYFAWDFVGNIMGDWVPSSTIARLPNASKSEVRQLLGEPEYANASKDKVELWVYRRPWCLAEFQVYFTPEGRVKEWYYDR
jgi:hypothetical protein